MRWVAIFVRNSGTCQLDIIKATKNSIGCSEMQPGLAFPCTASSASPRSNVGPAGCSETPPPVHTRRPDPPFQSLVNRREPTWLNLTLLFSIFFPSEGVRKLFPLMGWEVPSGKPSVPGDWAASPLHSSSWVIRLTPHSAHPTESHFDILGLVRLMPWT